jgi:hypothetical protein
MARTIARQVFSQARQNFAQSFISGASNLSHSAPHVLHASAHAAQEDAISRLPLVIMSNDRPQNLPQSATKCNALACSFLPSATCW